MKRAVSQFVKANGGLDTNAFEGIQFFDDNGNVLPEVLAIIEEAQAQADLFKKIVDDAKAIMFERIDSDPNHKKIDNSVFMASYKGASQRVNIDKELLLEKYPTAYEECVSHSPVKASLNFKFKVNK